MTREVEIRGGMIRLGQLLKLAGAVDGGAEAKSLIAAGAVQVNGEVETRRGRQLVPGDRVLVESEELHVRAGEDTAGAAAEAPTPPEAAPPTAG